MSALRVAHIITMLELGGAQQNTLYTVSHLNRNQFEAHLICGRGGILDEFASGMQGVNIHFCDSLVREIKPHVDLRAYHELIDELKSIRPHIVHTHSSKAGVLGRFAAARAGVPVIIHTYHGFGFHRFQNPLTFQLYLQIERQACRKTNHLIFVSRENWNWANQLGLTAGCTASLIRSGVETAKFSSARRNADFRKNIGIPHNAKVVGMIACLKPQKDPVTFVRAADHVTRSMPDVYFVLTGDGELREAVKKAASEMKYPERFVHLGWRYDVSQVLSELDVLVLTSLWEGLPRVIPEATIARVPVVASNIEGNREIIHEGKNGTLAEPRNSSDFAAKIMAALNGSWQVDPEYAAEIQHEFDIDEMVRQQEQLYLQLLSGVHA